jgi:hypothetical protein
MRRQVGRGVKSWARLRAPNPSSRTAWGHDAAKPPIIDTKEERRRIPPEEE